MSTPSAPFPPFSGHLAKCPKCNEREVSAKWLAAYRPCGDFEARPERMHRVCDHCGYAWVEMCADAPGEGKS